MFHDFFYTCLDKNETTNLFWLELNYVIKASLLANILVNPCDLINSG